MKILFNANLHPQWHFPATLNTACRWSKQSTKKKYCPFPRLLLLRRLPSYWVCNTELKGASKGHAEQEAKPSLSILMSWTAIISSSFYALLPHLAVAS